MRALRILIKNFAHRFILSEMLNVADHNAMISFLRADCCFFPVSTNCMSVCKCYVAQMFSFFNQCKSTCQAAVFNSMHSSTHSAELIPFYQKFFKKNYHNWIGIGNRIQKQRLYLQKISSKHANLKFFQKILINWFDAHNIHRSCIGQMVRKTKDSNIEWHNSFAAHTKSTKYSK